MPRPAKAKHVVARLREELGLRQKELAERVGISWRTYQDIETAKTRLSRRIAYQISEKTGASADWLLADDPEAPITNIEGERWSQKDRQRFQGMFGKSGPLADIMRLAFSCSSLPVLLQHYLEARDFFEQVTFKDAESLRRWHRCYERAWDGFLASEPEELSKYAAGKTATDIWSYAGLRSIRDDLDCFEYWMLKIGSAEAEKRK